MFTSSEIYDIAIRLEKNGEAFYQNALKTVTNPKHMNLIKRLAEDESKHGEWLAQQKMQLENNPENPEQQKFAESILKNILNDQTFCLQEIDLSQFHEPEKIIRSAIEFEKDTILFYEMLKPFIQASSSLKDLQNIIEEERQHISLLEKELLSLSL